MKYTIALYLSTFLLSGCVADAFADKHEHAYVTEDKTWFEKCCVEWSKVCDENDDRKACIESCVEYGQRAVTRWTCECGAAQTSRGRCTRIP